MKWTVSNPAGARNKIEPQQTPASSDEATRCVTGGWTGSYLRRGSHTRSFRGMGKPPGRGMAAGDGAPTSSRVEHFRTPLSRTEPTRLKHYEQNH